MTNNRKIARKTAATHVARGKDPDGRFKVTPAATAFGATLFSSAPNGTRAERGAACSSSSSSSLAEPAVGKSSGRGIDVSLQ